MYPEEQLHLKPSGLSSAEQVPPFRHGSGEHGLAVNKEKKKGDSLSA